MKKIPTAEEFWHNHPTDSTVLALIEFATLHLQAQQRAILEILEIRGNHSNIDHNIILNTYPITNVK